MSKKSLFSSFILFTAALIWGFAFTAQKEGMRFVGPMLFNGIRFLLGGLLLSPLLLFSGGRRRGRGGRGNGKLAIFAGLALFGGATLQQIGIVHTTVGNAGFITGLYIVFVPILGIFLRQRVSGWLWGAVALSVVGLFLLSVKAGFEIAAGDLWVLSGTLFWAGHVLIIDHATASGSEGAIYLAVVQYLICGLLNLIIAFFFERGNTVSIVSALPAILYSGVLSVSVAYTLQIIGQRHVHPVHAALILSFEGIFAALGGFLFLGELFSFRQTVGAAFMFAGIILSQTGQFHQQKNSGGTVQRRQTAGK